MTFDERALRRLLELHESRRPDPYDDATGETVELSTGGNVTIGIGRNLTANGLSNAEIEFLLANDVATTTRLVRERYPWIASVDPVRTLVLLDMMFNLGPTRLAKFAPTLALVAAKDYAGAVRRLRRTAWHRQTGSRALRDEKILLTGALPPELR